MEPAAEEQFTLQELLTILGEAVHALHCFRCREALAALRRLPPRQRGTALAQDMTARCHFELAEYEEAATVYSRSCEAFKQHRLLGLEFLSTAYWHLRDAPKLGRLAQEVLQWKDGRLRPQTWICVGNCLSLQGERDGAVRCFRRAVQLDPGFVYAYTLMGHEFAAGEKYQEALRMYECAVSVDDRHYNAWWGLGNVFYRQEEYLNARYHFQKALEINNGNAVLRTSLGMVLQALQKPERALPLLTAAERSPHCNAMAGFHKGCTLIALGRHEEARRALQSAQTMAPREPSVHFQLGRLHAATGDRQRALVHFTNALDLCGSKGSRDHQMMAAAQTELLNLAWAGAAAERVGGGLGCPEAAARAAYSR